MTQTQHPGGAKMVYEQLGERITDLNKIITSGNERTERSLERVESKFEKVVTKSEFDATVMRIDGQVEATDIKIDTVNRKLDSSLEGLRSEMHIGMERVSGESRKGFMDIAEATKERNSKNRWFWGTIIGAATLINGALWNLLSFLFR